MTLFERILLKRGLDTPEKRRDFLNPKYDLPKYDPFLLPDMDKAVERLVVALEAQEKIIVYGDYDVDGLTATTLLLDAFESFGFKNVNGFIPNRFVEGYGLAIGAVEEIAQKGAQLIVTVDCGSLSEKEIIRANELGVDIIVTDHHSIAEVQPPAVAVVNPKRLLQNFPDAYEDYVLKQSDKVDVLYPFLDLAGVGVAFKLVQALQTRLGGLTEGQEKWLLDLVALGTVSDVVNLVDENRSNVFWGLKVLAKTRRPGLRALMMVAGIDPEKLSTRSIGFGLAPRMNATGRLETALRSLRLLRADDEGEALEQANLLNEMNRERRAEQDRIFKEALGQAEEYSQYPVLVVSGKGWSHGIIGIVAAKLLEKYKKPTFVLEEMGKESKGSARSYGDFSAVDAIRSADDVIIKGGGHKMAAGVTLLTENIDKFRKRVNQFYESLGLAPEDQKKLLLPKEDAEAKFLEVTEGLVADIARLEPFGSGNLQPVLKTSDGVVVHVRQMGAESQHVKLTLRDIDGSIMQLIAFSAPEHFFVDIGEQVSVWYEPNINEWNGSRQVEGRLVRLEKRLDNLIA